MKIAYVASYPPRKCGIGTFTHSLAHAMREHGEGTDEINIIALNDHHKNYEYPPEVKMMIHQEQQADYLEAADFINRSGAEACVLEHEYGIYGGQNGVYILPLLHRLHIPLITTLHTILETPSYNERAILKEICKLSDRVVVMSRKAVELLGKVYNVKEEKITRIEHGVPDIHFDREEAKTGLKLNEKKLLLTFGFLGRNKGIETVIKALPKVIDEHPEVLYVVLGKTHPNVLRNSGEEYRHYLQLLTKKLEVDKHVLMINEFIDETELFKYLAACDIYITPYVNEAQITSGTLTYAMGSGCVVVSTPYWHAAELLTGNKGRLFDFKDVDRLAKILNELLDEPGTMKTIQKKAEAYGKDITWPKTGKRYDALVREVLAEPKKPALKKKTDIDLSLLPKFSLAHIRRLTDDTGIIQHAKFGIPNLKKGYCLDDNARALLMVCMSYNQKKDPLALRLMPLYLSYIHYMQNKDGTFRNLLSFNRDFIDEVGSEDSFGRTIWVLGYLMHNAPKDAYYQTAKLIFLDAAPNFEKLESIRGIANTMIGICYYLRTNASDEAMRTCLRTLTDTLLHHFEQNQSRNWSWFEPLLAYDNGILPLALLHASRVLGDQKVTETAFKAMDFLTRHTLKDGYLSVIGNKQWYVKGKERSIYAQQPIDAMAMVLMYYQAFVVTGQSDFLKKLFTSFMWFLGDNDLCLGLYDFETKGCCDGFDDFGINRNQGAESTLAYLISHLTVLQAYEKSFRFDESNGTGSTKEECDTLVPA